MLMMPKSELKNLLLHICAIVMEVEPDEMDPAEEFAAWGIDSVAAAMIHDLVESCLIREDCEFSFNDFLNYTTIDQLAGALIRQKVVRDEKITIDSIYTQVGRDEVMPPDGRQKCRNQALPLRSDDGVGFRFHEIGFYGPGHKTRYDGKEIISFASNDYLSLATDSGVQAAAAKAIREYGTGCGSSMLGSGSLAIHGALAEELADFLDKEAVLLMPAGYMAMLGFCSTRIMAGYTIFSDALNHRSIIDGLRLGKGASERKDGFHFFNHNSLKSLQQIRKVVCSAEVAFPPDIVLLEGVYSMDGDRGNLDEFVPFCKEQNIQVAVDDAHGIGVLGDHGRGTADEYDQTDDVDYILGTFSKSFGAAGGFVAASGGAIDELRQQCSQYMFSASLTPPVVETVRHVLRLIRKDNSRQMKLWENIDYFRSCLSVLNITAMESDSAIFPIPVKSEEKALDCARQLLDQKGIFVLPVIYPVVPKKKARLRISINSGHSRSDIDYLTECLAEILLSVD